MWAAAASVAAGYVRRATSLGASERPCRQLVNCIVLVSPAYTPAHLGAGPVGVRLPWHPAAAREHLAALVSIHGGAALLFGAKRGAVLDARRTLGQAQGLCVKGGGTERGGWAGRGCVGGLVGKGGLGGQVGGALGGG